MHDGGGDAPCSTIANGDHFLARQLPAIMATPWYRERGTIILTWDEGADSDKSGAIGDTGGHILTIVISSRTKGAPQDRQYVDTAGILRTIDQAYGVSYLGDAARPESGTLPLGSDQLAALTTGAGSPPGRRVPPFWCRWTAGHSTADRGRRAAPLCAARRPEAGRPGHPPGR